MGLSVAFYIEGGLGAALAGGSARGPVIGDALKASGFVIGINWRIAMLAIAVAYS